MPEQLIIHWLSCCFGSGINITHAFIPSPILNTQYWHTWNLFKINWIHRTEFRACMIAYESFSNVFRIRMCHLFYLYAKRMHGFLSVVIVACRLVCEMVFMNMQPNCNKNLSLRRRQRWVSTVLGYNFHFTNTKAKFNTKPNKIIINKFWTVALKIIEPNILFIVSPNIHSRAENYTKTNNNCTTCRWCGRQLERSQANTKKWEKKANFEHEILSTNEIHSTRFEWNRPCALRMAWVSREWAINSNGYLAKNIKHYPEIKKKEERTTNDKSLH